MGGRWHREQGQRSQFLNLRVTPGAGPGRVPLHIHDIPRVSEGPWAVGPEATMPLAFEVLSGPHGLSPQPVGSQALALWQMQARWVQRAGGGVEVGPRSVDHPATPGRRPARSGPSPEPR